MVFGKLGIDDYACEDCGAMADRPAKDLCDTCLLKFYFDNPNASSFADWIEPDKFAKTNEGWQNSLDLTEQVSYANGFYDGKTSSTGLFGEQFDYFSKGYDGGVEDVLTALIEFCGQGGILDAKNVVAWANTYAKETNPAKEQEQN
jgi:hypothetical protein